jgi:hypothetical protein
MMALCTDTLEDHALFGVVLVLGGDFVVDEIWGSISS